MGYYLATLSDIKYNRIIFMLSNLLVPSCSLMFWACRMITVKDDHHWDALLCSHHRGCGGSSPFWDWWEQEWSLLCWRSCNTIQCSTIVPLCGCILWKAVFPVQVRPMKTNVGSHTVEHHRWGLQLYLQNKRDAAGLCDLNSKITSCLCHFADADVKIGKVYHKWYMKVSAASRSYLNW